MVFNPRSGTKKSVIQGRVLYDLMRIRDRLGVMRDGIGESTNEGRWRDGEME